MRSLIAAAVLIAIAGSASAADAKGGYAVLGTGSFTCGDFLSGPKDVGKIVTLWVDGYATALNQSLPGVKDVTGGRSNDQIADALYSECNGHNDMILADATRNMIMKMADLKPAAAGKKSKKADKTPAPAPADDVPELRH